MARSGPLHSAHSARYVLGGFTRRFTARFVCANVICIGEPLSLNPIARADFNYVLTADSKAKHKRELILCDQASIFWYRDLVMRLSNVLPTFTVRPRKYVLV